MRLSALSVLVTLTLTTACESPLDYTPYIREVGVGSHALAAADVTALEQVTYLTRYTIYWNLWSDPGYQAKVREEIDRAHDAGLDVLVVVHGQPENVADVEVNSAYAAFLGRLVATFPEVNAWQVWNEPNVSTFTDLFPTGELYAAAITEAYAAVKQVEPGDLVVTAGLAWPWREYLAQMDAAGARYDVLAVHAYGFPVDPVLEESVNLLYGRRVWLTEFGLSSEQVPHRGDQAHHDRWQLETWQSVVRRSGSFERIYGYQLYTEEDTGYGILKKDRSPRSVYHWLKERHERP